VLLELVLTTEAVSLGAPFLPFLAEEGAGLADGLAFLAASHSGEPTIALVVKNKIRKKWARLRLPGGAGVGGGTGKALCGRGRHIGAPVFASEGASQYELFGYGCLMMLDIWLE
jgi:hypothetical protein